MNSLFYSVAGKATAGLCITTLLFFWPAVAVGLIGCGCFAFAIAWLETACERLRRQAAEIDHHPPLHDQSEPGAR
jgi:hypothetical protein